MQPGISNTFQQYYQLQTGLLNRVLRERGITLNRSGTNQSLPARVLFVSFGLDRYVARNGQKSPIKLEFNVMQIASGDRAT